MDKMIFILVLTLVVFGCATTKLSDAGKNVRLMKTDPPKACVELGSVKGYIYGNKSDPDNVEEAKNEMRNSAAEKGANYVRWDIVDTSSGG